MRAAVEPGWAAEPREAVLGRYYRVHARVYDATRWTFLFGRREMVRRAVASAGTGGPVRHVLEIGCGTGANLVQLARELPGARLTGVDASGSMLSVAARRLRPLGGRVTLVPGFYERPLGLDPAPDLILFSYCLSMVADRLEPVLGAAARELAPWGRVAVVDFHASPHAGFRQWMGLNHVRMDGQIVPALARHFVPEQVQVRRAFLGLWSYVLHLGCRRAPAGASGLSG